VRWTCGQQAVRHAGQPKPPQVARQRPRQTVGEAVRRADRRCRADRRSVQGWPGPADGTSAKCIDSREGLADGTSRRASYCCARWLALSCGLLTVQEILDEEHVQKM